MKNIDECEFEADIDYKCCCSHPINHVYKIINKYTKLCILVGSECVDKYGITTLKENLKEVKRIETKKKKNRLCQSCDEYVIKLREPEWKKICNKCWRIGHTRVQLAPALKSSCSQCNNTMWFNGALCDGCFQ